MTHPPPEALAEFLQPFPADDPAVTPDYMVGKIENLRLGWSLDHTGNLIEARIWAWPTVIGRHRPQTLQPLAQMLWAALQDAHRNLKNQTTAYA
jgi:hypothetical protein